MKKNEELKQSKISRHEIAKEKFRFFERSMSCKSLNNKTDFVPAPGQFAIITNPPKKKTQQPKELPSLHVPQQKQQRTEKSIKFTTNLKLITRERSPSRVSQLLNDTVNRKIDQHRSLKKIVRSESSGNLRPYTAISTQLVHDLQGKNSLKESKIISTAVQHDKKYYLKKQSVQGNTFIVKSRSGIPKHAYGYKSIRLTSEDGQRKLKLQSETKNERKFTKIQTEEYESEKQNFFTTEAQPNFLPIEYYMIDDQKPEDLIQKYKLKENYMVGYSKWQNLQGNYEWKKCRVLDYIKDKQRWQIQWLHNGKKKIVARNNLFFQKENFQTFEKIISDAQNFRKHSEAYMKYNWLIDSMKGETHTLQEYQLSRIMKLVNNNVSLRFKSEKVEKAVESLVEEVKQKYIRANHVVQFNAGLPFNVKYKQEFLGYLPDRYFVPNSAAVKFDFRKSRQLKTEQKITENAVGSQKVIQAKVNPTHQLKKLFETSSRKFTKITPLSSPNRIHILQFLNKSQNQISTQQVQSPYDLTFHLSNPSAFSPSLKFFCFYPTKMYSLQDVIQRIDSSLFESIAKLNNIVCEVEYFVAKELDPIYAEKKTVGMEAFDDIISGYRRFLGAVNMRIEAMGRQLLFGMLNQLQSLLQVDQSLVSCSDSESFFSLLEQQKKAHPSMKLKITFEIKGQTIEPQPKKQQITEAITSYITRLIEQFSMVSCIRKSYVSEIRPKNKMKIIESLQQSENGNDMEWRFNKELMKIREGLEKKVAMCDKTYERFYSQIKKIWDKILSLQGDIKRKAGKKSNFSDIQQHESTIKQVTQTLSLLKMLSINSSLNFKPQQQLSKPQPSAQQGIQQLSAQEEMARKISLQAPFQTEVKFIKLGFFSFNIDECISKCESKLYEISYELYKLVMEKIVKQNEKMDKQIDTIIQRLEKQPTNIKEMIQLEQYIHEQASEELWKISNKINDMQDKYKLLEKLNIEIDYKDYYECHKIYMKPIKIRAVMNQKVKDIDVNYRKMFGEELVKEIGQLTQQIRQIEEKFYQSITIKSIEQMDSSFIVFSKLKQRIEYALGKSAQVNEYETAMKWINTNFSRVIDIKSEFMPYYQLISLEKNYRFHIESQLTQSLHSIDATGITHEVINGCDELVNLEVNVFYCNPTILKIVKGVGKSYTGFRDKLALIQILRNTDLRERHWISIKELTGFTDIQSQKITFQELQQREIKKYEKKLIEISHIATRQLIYEKRLNKMKKEWKQLKIHMVKLIEIPPSEQQPQQPQSQLQNQLKIISNLQNIQTKTQNDIYQIQQILSSSFIKFLQKDIINWRNSTLYKMYEFVEIWKMIEKEIVQMYKMFSKPVMKNQASTEYQKFKLLEKNWKNITTQIEQQPNVLELLQTKINESLKYTVELIEDLRKSVNHYFEKKKQRFSRFGALSQEQLIALYSDNNEQKEIFDQAVRKCLQGVKNVVRNKSQMITSIKTHLDQEIQISHGAEMMKGSDDATPDRIIEDIERRIKKSLRKSIDSIDELGERRGKILQIVLFHQRIIFTREVENQLISDQKGSDEQKGIKEGYLNALLTFKQKIIQALFVQYEKMSLSQTINKKPQNLIKIQTELNQLINHIQIAEHLYRKNVTNIFDFEWVSQIRTYQHSNNYFVETGLNRLEYGFEITDQQQYVVEEASARIFCNLAMAMKERMFGLLTGNIGTGKLALFHYLAGIHGKNQLIINCHKALSHQNAFDFLRMCANGIWIVFNSINLLSREVFSCFRQSVQLFWANYPTPKSKPHFMLGDKNITFSTHEIGLFGTLNTTKNNTIDCEEISHKLSNYFRTFSMPKMDVQYLMECKLLLAGFEEMNTARFLKMVDIVEQQCQGFYEMKQNEGLDVYGKLTFSKLNFIEKVIAFTKELKQVNKEKQNIEEYMIFEQGLAKGIQEITRNLGTLKSQITCRLTTLFDFLITPQSQKPLHQSTPPPTSHQQLTKLQIKKLFSTQNLHPSKPQINHYFDIIQTLKQKHSVIVLGNCSTGKSLLIDLLQQNKVVKEEQFADDIMFMKEERFVYIDEFRITLRHVHPNGYSLKELFGDVEKNGVVNCLIKEGYEELEKEVNSRKQAADLVTSQQSKPEIPQYEIKNHQLISSSVPNIVSSQQKPFHHRGIVFDSEISSWIEPLLPLIKSSSNYVQPNGKNVIVEHPLKLIFECRDVSSVSPSIILSTSIVHFQQTQIKWQDIMNHFIKKNFKPCYQKKVFVEHCEVLVSVVMEPILQFFRSSISTNASVGKATQHPHAQQENRFVETVYKCLMKNQLNYIPLIFNLFIALVQDYYNSIKQTVTLNTKSQHKTHQQSTDFHELFPSSTIDDNDRTVILNLFMMAVTWTMGLFIPEQSKKTFSRHFKYLIKRAIQLNIKGILKDSLPKDQDDIYQICFIKNKWYQWEEVPNIIKKSTFVEENIPEEMAKHLEDSIPLKTKTKYLYILDKYSQANLPFFVVGKSSSGKNSLMLEFINTCSTETYNKILLACTSQTTQQSAKHELKKEMQKEKYSHAFRGFVHRKTTLFYVCDMNLPFAKNEPSLDEFLHEYLKRHGWYLDHTGDFFEFKNIIFCGTLNSSVKFSQHLLKYVNPLPYVESEDDIKSKLFSIFEQNEFLLPYSQNVVKLMTNLQEVVSRELKTKFMFGSFNYRDLCQIAQGITSKITHHMFGNEVSMQSIEEGKAGDSFEKSTKKKILQCWIIQTEKKYRQRFGAQYDQEKIFYFINNVLMEEERTRYKNILPQESIFLSNLEYYLGKLRISQFKSMKKGYKTTKIFYTPSSYKIYQNLEQINEEIQSLERILEKTYELKEIEEESLARQIQSAIESKQNIDTVISYLKSMTSMLDYLMEQKNHLMFLIDDRKDESLLQIATDHDRLQMESTLRQHFTFSTHKYKLLSNSKHNRSQMDRLLQYVTRINNSQILSYQRNQHHSDGVLQWKLFITELFELINSTASLNDRYIIHLKNLSISEMFILEDLLSLKRTGTLSMLEEYLNSEQIDLDEAVEKPVDPKPEQKDEVEDDSDEEDEQGVAKRKKMLAEERMRKKNTLQLIREKILSKLKFVITIDESKLEQFKQNYSILLQKCHILWFSHLYPAPHQEQSTNPSFTQPLEASQQPTSLQASKNSIKSIPPSQKSITSVLQQEQSDKMLQKQNKLSLHNLYNDQKQVLSNSVSFSDLKEVYLALHTEEWGKEIVLKINQEIVACQNVEFARFLKLCHNMKLGVERKVFAQLKIIQNEFNYFNSLSSELLPTLLTLITQKKSLLFRKQQELADFSQKIEKLSEEKQKFISYFTKSQDAINLLQKQSRQANELYHQCIGLQEKNFTKVQFALVDLLKSAKDRKVMMTNEMKLYVEMFGLLINKKIKPEQAMHKQIVKDIAALKIHKKVSNLLVQMPLGQKPTDKTTILSEKAIAKLKQFVTKNLQAQFTKKTQSKQEIEFKENFKQLAFSDALLILLKDYFIYTLTYFNKTQEENIKALNKKCLKCLKELSKTKEEYQKSFKSKQYEKVVAELEEIQKQKVDLLNVYDTENKILEKLTGLEKRSLKIVCMNTNGDMDQKEMARKKVIQKDLLPNTSSPSATNYPSANNQLQAHILVQKIKQDYMKEKQHLISILTSKDVLALLLASKVCINSLKSTAIDTGIITKILSRQAIDLVRSIKLESWESCFERDGYREESKDEQTGRIEKVDFVEYLLKEFSGVKVMELMSGVVCIERNEASEKWLARQTSKPLRYQSSIVDRLESSILQSNQPSKLQNLQSQRSDTISQKSIISLTNQLTITQITSIYDVQNFLTQITECNRQLTDYLASNSIILVYEKLSTQTLKSTLNTKMKFILSQTDINWVSIDSKSSEQVKFIQLIENKIEDELSQDRKDSDIKTMNKWKELRESMQENAVQRKTLIKNQFIQMFLDEKSSLVSEMGHTSRWNRIPTNQPLITLIQDDKPTNRSPIATQRFSASHNELLTLLSTHLAQLKQNLFQYASITQSIQLLPNLLNLKKKSNIQTTKLIRYLARIYLGLRILQNQHLIIETTTFQRFSQMVLWMVQKQKEAQKGQISQIKLIKQIKNRIWQFHLVSLNHRKLFVGVVFALAGQETLTEIEFDKLLKLIFRLYIFSTKITNIDQKLTKRMDDTSSKIQKPNQQNKLHLIHNFILKPTTQKYQKIQVSQTFEQVLDMISESFSCFTDLKHNFKRKLNVWVQFIKNIDDKFGQNLVNTLPEPYNDINRAYFGLFVALGHPEKLRNWVDVHLAEEDLTKLNENELLSNESKILRMPKFSYKQTVLIGDSSLSLLSSLSVRTRKQLKLYSRVSTSQLRQHSSSLNQRNTPALSRKQIPFKQMNQLSYFANRKMEQELVEEMYQCVKNSGWLVIDCDNLIDSINGDTEFYRLEAIVKMIDMYTTSSANDQQHDDQDHIDTQLGLMESSKNLNMKKSVKQQITMSSFQTCDYQIFFILSGQNKKLINKTTLLNNYKRSVIEINDQNDVTRCLELNRLYHEELNISKKMAKDYEVIDISVKMIAYYGLKIVQEALSRIMKLKIMNEPQINALSVRNLTHFTKLREVTDKFTKILNLILQDPQYLLELLSPNRKILKLPKQQKQESKQAQKQRQITTRGKNEPKTNSRFQKEREENKKKTLKLIVKPSIYEEENKEESQQKSIKKIGSITRDNMSNRNLKKQPNKNKYFEVIELLKLFQSYLQSTLRETELISTGFVSLFNQYTEDYFVKLNTKTLKQDDQKEFVRKVQTIMLGDPNKLYTSNKPIIEELINVLNLNLKEKPKAEQLLQMKSALAKNQLAQFDLGQYNFDEVKLFVERLVDGYRHKVNEEEFSHQIQTITELKKKSQQESYNLKKQLFPHQHHPLPTLKLQSNQFNFSSLMENLTIEDMRKKLARNSPTSQLSHLTHSNQTKHYSAVSRLKEYLWKKKQEYHQGLERKLGLLRSLKPVFLLERISYHCMWEVWKKSDKHNTLLNLVQTLIELDNHEVQQSNYKTLSFNINYFKKQENFKINSFLTSSQPVPVFDLQNFRATHELPHLLNLMKSVFIEVNNLKHSDIKHHFFLESKENLQKKNIQHPTKSTNLYKICDLQGFGMHGLQTADERTLPKDNGKIVLTINEEDGFVWSKDLGVKLGVYFEETEGEESDDEDKISQSEGESNEQVQLKEMAKTSVCDIKFFLNKLSELSNVANQSNKKESVVDSVQVQILNSNKLWNKHNTNAYMFY